MRALVVHMERIDLNKTRKSKWLHLKQSIVYLIVTVLFRVLFRSTLLLSVGLLVIDVIFPLRGAEFNGYLGGVLLISFSAGVWEVVRDFRLREIGISSLVSFRSSMRKRLELDGFRVENDSKNFMYAVRTQGRVHISDQFYAVYTKGGVLICPAYELPFPFSYYLSKKMERACRDAARKN